MCIRDSHDIESEVCFDCAIQYDDEGMITAVVHRSIDMATAKAGLMDGTLDVDDDGNLVFVPQPEV